MEQVPNITRKPSRKSRARRWCIEKLILIVTVAFMATYGMPRLFPTITDPLVSTTLAGIIALPIAICGAKALANKE